MTLMELAQKLKDKGESRTGSIWGYSKEDSAYSLAMHEAAIEVELWAKVKAMEYASVLVTATPDQIALLLPILRHDLGIPESEETND